MPVFPAETLTDFARRVLIAGGATGVEADRVAESLVEANLCGHDSHGVVRLSQYVASIKAGEIVPGATLSVLRETPAMIAADGGWGFGQVLGRDLTGRLIEKARTVGVGCGTLMRSAHLGRMGEYAEQAAAAGMASVVLADLHGGPQRVAPVGGIRPRLGTNPLCLGFPGGAEGPFVLDFGTSATAEGKVRVAKIAGKNVPPGWLLDAAGEPTTNPETLYAEPPGSILPMGGDQAHKGFGLAFLIELFASGLSGAAAAGPTIGGKGNAAFFLIVSPEHAAGADHLAATAAGLEAYVRDVPRKAGVGPITLPGDPERRTAADRRDRGIELDSGNWAALAKLADSLGVALPEAAT